MVELMIATREGVFTQKGGHEFSGGFTVDADAIHFLEDALVEAHVKMEKKEKIAQLPDADKALLLSQVNEEIFQAVDALAPFGVGNPKPVFSFPGVTILKSEQFGKTRNHLKLTLTDKSMLPGRSVQAIAFFATPDDYPNAEVRDGARVTVLGTFEKSYFRGRPELRLRILDITAA
jgi:single-stranded-DNA-specific exonuclease